MQDVMDLHAMFVEDCAKLRERITNLALAIEEEEVENTQIISPNPYVMSLRKLRDEILEVENEFKEIM